MHAYIMYSKCTLIVQFDVYTSVYSVENIYCYASFQMSYSEKTIKQNPYYMQSKYEQNL
jgi:hypothetical protein